MPPCTLCRYEMGILVWPCEDHQKSDYILVARYEGATALDVFHPIRNVTLEEARKEASKVVEGVTPGRKVFLTKVILTGIHTIKVTNIVDWTR